MKEDAPAATQGTTIDAPPGGTGAPLAGRRVLGGRYEIRGALGRGGMGEVWLARDMKLQVDVALKVVLSEKLSEAGALERLRAEVRAARAVASPHVCRVYDLVEVEGLECISMEYVDGTTLRNILATRTPLDSGEAREIALQFLSGLGAIHEAGLVHRDVKPENIMLTRAGRVVLMDFGIAKAAASGGTIAGTPAYWPPEQAAGAPADPRADIFAAGLLLAEMVAPSGVREQERREALLRGLRADPPRVPDTTWAEPIRKAVAREPGKRYESARALARALEEVAERISGTTIEKTRPYPGLSSFTEADARFFFGREAEVESAWIRLPNRHLLAVVGPSGAGKSSFLMAGLIPAKPDGWAHLVCTPGDAPFVALEQALVPEVSRDTQAMRQMLRFEDAGVAVELFRRWRSAHAETLVVVDQFEELFTLNSPEVQGRFAALLSRLVLEADVHVLLSMRDDFLLRCQEHEGLRPVFSDLMPLGAPAGDSLRRALVQPALKCGYRFEDEGLVAEMLRAVEGERGALPLLAFAANELWERRDREQGLLTRAAYEAIGGVGGALAQHAEATLGRIGPEKLPVVRELFRNLVTAEGTRAVRDVDDLLTLFPESGRAGAEAVVRALVDARLLTSYEAHATEPGQKAGRRVEVVHESLLGAWPRLVRWRTEDEAGAQIRDQLRQAARLWDEKGRTNDLLWTGTAFQEFELWRGRYAGALTALEEDFGRAMRARAQRRRRRQRLAVTAVIAVLAAVAIAVGISRQQAVGAARRAEASKLLAFGQERLASDPTEALAYTTASLELSDTWEARLFAVQTLWESPPAREIAIGKVVWLPSFSPDGRMLAAGGYTKDSHVFREDGGPPVVLSDNGNPFWVGGRIVLFVFSSGKASVFLPDGRHERSFDFGGSTRVQRIGSRLYGWTAVGGKQGRPAELSLWSWAPAEGSPVELGRVPPSAAQSWGPAGASWLHARGATLLGRPFPWSPGSPDRVLGEHPPGIASIRSSEDLWSLEGNQVVTLNSAKEQRLWTLEPGKPPREESLPSPEEAPDAVLRRGWFSERAAQGLRLWKSGSWPSARPLFLRRNVSWYMSYSDIRQAGDWLVASTDGYTRLTLWPLQGQHPLVVDGYNLDQKAAAFSADGRWLATSWPGAPIRLWPLVPGSEVPRDLAVPGLVGYPRGLSFDPRGRFLFCAGSSIWIVPLDGRAPLELKGFSKVPWINATAVSPSGRFAAAGYCCGEGDRAIRVWDLETGATRAFDLPAPSPPSSSAAQNRANPSRGIDGLSFSGESTLYSSAADGVRRWDLASGRQEMAFAAPRGKSGVAEFRPDLRLALTRSLEEDCAPLVVHDLASGSSRELSAFGACVDDGDLDPSGKILVTSGRDGILRVGHLAGGEPHLLVGHKGQASMKISPDLKWIASFGADNTLRLWPMPDLDAPPLHTLPRKDLLARLRSLTNLRAVRDAKSATGWKIEVGRFPGWKDVPAWQP